MAALLQFLKTEKQEMESLDALLNYYLLGGHEQHCFKPWNASFVT